MKNKITSLSQKLRHNPDDIATQHRYMEACLERSIEIGLQVSPEDAELLYSYAWKVAKNGYAYTNLTVPAGFGNAGGNKTKYHCSLHRLVLSRQLGMPVWEIPSDIHADHIYESRGKLDCRRDNIQPLTAAENSRKRFVCEKCGYAKEAA